MRIKIVSMVTVASLGGVVDLDIVAKELGHYLYEPDQYPALFYFNRKPRISFAFFSSGRVVTCGGSSLKTVREALRQLISRLSLFRTGQRLSQPRIRNIVGTLDLHEPIDIETIAQVLERSLYEPEQFPGLIWRIDSKVVLLFRSGKIVVTGARSLAELNKTGRYVIDVLSHFSTNQKTKKREHKG